MIRYVKRLNSSRDSYQEVSHDDIDDWTVKDFESNGMFEELETLEFVRFHIDLDFHQDDPIIDMVNDTIKALNDMKSVFGTIYIDI